jgi:nucleotidyltransferase substrate binding protein (TIGR01987 family)
MTKISLDPLENALVQLERALAQPKDEFVRDSVIQRFEFTFELSWRTMQRFIELDRPLPDTSTKTILRESLAQGLISDIDQWFEFQKYRNMTSHIYSQEVAEMIYDKIVQFPRLCRKLIDVLKAKQK